MAVYFFYGDEEYNIELEINKLKNKLLDKNFAAMNFKTIDNPNFAELSEILRTQPMMFGNMMIVINIEETLTKSFEDKEIDELSGALKNNIESLFVIFVAKYPRNEGKKPDSRKKLFKTITKYAQTQEFPTFKTYKTDDIINWINKEAKKHDLTIEKDAALTLVEQIGNNLRDFAKEIEKLKLLAYPETKITKAMVKEICISNDDLFGFTDFLLKGEKGLALREFEKLLDKKHPLEIIATLQTMIRRWILIKTKSQQMPLSEVSKLTGQHEFVIKTTLEKMKNTPLKSIVSLKQKLTTAEYRIKSGEAIDAICEVENAILGVE